MVQKRTEHFKETTHDADADSNDQAKIETNRLETTVLFLELHNSDAFDIAIRQTFHCTIMKQ